MTRAGRTVRAGDGFTYEAHPNLGYLVYNSDPPHEHLGSVQKVSTGPPPGLRGVAAGERGWRARRHDESELPDLFATRYGAAIALRSEPPTLL